MTVAVEPNPLILPIVYRDFLTHDAVGGHPDFWSFGGVGDADIAQSQLGANGKPVHSAAQQDHTVNNDPGITQDFYSFWYRDDNNNYARPVVETLTLGQIGAGTYQYDSNQFFPIDGRGWGDTPNGGTRNFLFTSEIRYWFEYRGGETLDFTGDDDLWVFINKQLAVDLGGLHPARSGSVVLHATNGTGATCDFVNITPSGDPPPCTAPRTVNLGLQIGSVYEISIFHAERSPGDSNFKLTLSGFAAKRSSCNSVCGDAIVTADEVCDLGTAANTGAYGTCNANCTLPARCGDNTVQAGQGEECDDGSNLATYSTGALRCGPGCKWASRCGDTVVDGGRGEACDQGADNGKGYGFCTATCQLGPRCGDKATTNGEQCDDGNANGTSQSLCTDMCTLKCGNGMVDGGEQCDNGAAQNTGGYGKCNANCTFGPRCGDGIKSNPEQCDDGKNDGSYGTCANMCVLGPRCGDGAVQDTAGEKCDLGANNASGYGKGKCTPQCRPAPFCGDRAVDLGSGEACDDGVNSGLAGSCTVDCKGWVELPKCGDGTKDPGEQCDDGTNVNGTANSSCDVRCRNKCGNGFVDPGEQCDNGENDGSYGTCTATCQRADYCGDGKKNGLEGCDLGANNAANPYGPNKCTTQCTVAPYCGDGRIQSGFNEECDGQPGCNATGCTYPIPE
jgi:fibro-slime domain-containing protein